MNQLPPSGHSVSWHLATMLLLVAGIGCFVATSASMSMTEQNDSRILEEVVVVEEEEPVEGLSVDVSFEAILKTVIFLMTSWMMAVLSQLVGLPGKLGFTLIDLRFQPLQLTNNVFEQHSSGRL